MRGVRGVWSSVAKLMFFRNLKSTEAPSGNGRTLCIQPLAIAKLDCYLLVDRDVVVTKEESPKFKHVKGVRRSSSLYCVQVRNADFDITNFPLVNSSKQTSFLTDGSKQRCNELQLVLIGRAMCLRCPPLRNVEEMDGLLNSKDSN